jgi:membrane protein
MPDRPAPAPADPASAPAASGPEHGWKVDRWRRRADQAGDRFQRSFAGTVAARFVEVDLLTQAASLTFFALVSLAPLLVLVLWLAASLYPSAQASLLAQIGDLAGAEAMAVAETVLRNASARPDIGSFAGLWSTVLLFVGATTVFARLQATLNLVFHTNAQQLGGLLVWLRKRVFSFGVVFALGFLIIVSTLLSTLMSLLFANAPLLMTVAGDGVSLLVYVLAFALMYHYLPDRRVSWRQAWIGGAITTALFVLGRWLIGLYLTEAAPGSAYGSMGTLVIMLVWMYYAALVFFVGALVTAVVDERIEARKAAHRAARSSPPPSPQRHPPSGDGGTAPPSRP